MEIGGIEPGATALGDAGGAAHHVVALPTALEYTRIIPRRAARHICVCAALVTPAVLPTEEAIKVPHSGHRLGVARRS
jgi:hypothetical protein